MVGRPSGCSAAVSTSALVGVCPFYRFLLLRPLYTGTWYCTVCLSYMKHVPSLGTRYVSQHTHDGRIHITAGGCKADNNSCCIPVSFVLKVTLSTLLYSDATKSDENCAESAAKCESVCGSTRASLLSARRTNFLQFDRAPDKNEQPGLLSVWSML